MSRKKKEKILVVDDEPDTLELVKFILEKGGFDVTPALSGEEALNILKKEEPDLVLLDIMMPKLNGWSVFKKMKGRHKNLKIAFLTIVEVPESKKRELKREGAADYIEKPVMRKEFLKRVKKLVGGVLV